MAARRGALVPARGDGAGGAWALDAIVETTPGSEHTGERELALELSSFGRPA